MECQQQGHQKRLLKRTMTHIVSTNEQNISRCCSQIYPTYGLPYKIHVNSCPRYNLATICKCQTNPGHSLLRFTSAKSLCMVWLPHRTDRTVQQGQQLESDWKSLSWNTAMEYLFSKQDTYYFVGYYQSPVNINSQCDFFHHPLLFFLFVVDILQKKNWPGFETQMLWG